MPSGDLLHFNYMLQVVRIIALVEQA